MDNSRTVSEFLGLVLDHEPARYDIGTEPAEEPPARPPCRRASPLDRTKVVPFISAVRSGVPDADVARAAGVTVSQVRGWRLRLGLKRKAGTTAAARIEGALLSTPELASLLRSYDQPEAAEPPTPVRVSHVELERLLALHGLTATQWRKTGYVERCGSAFRGRP